MLRNILRYLFYALFASIIGLMVVPYIYKDDLIANLKATINENFNAEIGFSDLDISLIRSFPKLSVTLEQPFIKGIDRFEDITLIKSDKMRITTDFKALFADVQQINLSEVILEDADINIQVINDTIANYNIVKPSKSDSPGYVFNLDRYEIRNSNLSYTDHRNKTEIRAKGFSHTGKGNFSADQYNLFAQTEIELLDLSVDHFKYISRSKASGKNVLAIDNTTGTYKIIEGDFVLNELPFNARGHVISTKEKLYLDLIFNTNEVTFAQAISALPNTYKGEISNIESKGNAMASGYIKGDYSGKQFPDYEFKFDVADAYLKYPDLPKAIDRVDAHILVRSRANKLSLHVPQIHLLVGDNTMSGSFSADHFHSTPYIVSDMKVDFNLADLQEAFPFEGIQQLGGQLKSDFSINSKMSDIQQSNFKDIAFEGNASITNLIYQTQNNPKISAPSIKVNASPQALTIANSDINLGESDVNVEGVIKNPLAYFVDDKKMSGEFKVMSNKLNYNEWVTESKETNATTVNPSLDALVQVSGLTLDAKVKELKYLDYTLIDNHLVSKMSAERFIIEDYSGKIEGQNFSLKGQFDNVYNYLFSNEMLMGNVHFTAANFDANKILSSGSSTQSEPFLVPNNVHITITTDVDQLKYGKMDFANLESNILVKDQQIQFSNLDAKSLGGSMAFEGLYQTTNQQPQFSLKYDMSQIHFDQAYRSLQVIQDLAPLMDLIDGKFNSTLVMEGSLTNDMSIDLNSLDASGFIETIHGFVKKMGGLEKINNKLGIDAFSNVDLSNSKNWFEIKKGRVEIKPQAYQIKEINAIFSGNHAFNQDMDYQLLTSVPRAAMKNNIGGQIAESGLSWVESEAKKLGLNLSQGDTLLFDIRLGGKLLNPTVRITPLSAKGKSAKDQIKDEVYDKLDATKDSLRIKRDKKVKEIKDTVSNIITSATDTLTKKVNSKADSLANKAKEKANKVIKDKLDTVIGGKVNSTLDTLIQDKVKDVLGDKGKKEVDQIKDKLKNWNPFEKKKDGKN